jgi:hypothetical protein
MLLLSLKNMDRWKFTKRRRSTVPSTCWYIYYFSLVSGTRHKSKKLSSKKSVSYFSELLGSLVLEFETIEDPNKHTQIDEKDKLTTWPLDLVFSFYTLKIHHRDRQFYGPFIACITMSILEGTNILWITLDMALIFGFNIPGKCPCNKM